MEYVELTYQLGYVIDDVPAPILELIRSHCEKAEDLGMTYKGHLVGQIQSSWEVKFDDELVPLVDYLSTLASEYETSTGKQEAPVGTRKLFRHQDFWLNHQRKTQFQPAHTHSADYSFVVWLKVPYDIEEEFNQDFVGQARESWAGCFSFLNPGPFSCAVNPTRLPVDRTYEGKIVLFPSKLTHIVYPFYTSDEVRVSFAGNLAEPVLVDY
jgi:hypothetical protein